MFSLKASAPASMMLLGEHAVLQNYSAIVCAINRRITVNLTPRSDNKIHIESALGEFKSTLDNFSSDPRFKFICAVIESFRNKLIQGFNLNIHSDFSHQVGLGSSAAVTTSCVCAFDRWLNAGFPFDLHTVFLAARSIVQNVQGLGSGADVAASVWGGTLAYQMNPLSITKLKYNPPISAVYSGHKTPTPEVVRWLEAEALKFPERIQTLFEKINASCVKATAFINQGDWSALGSILNENQRYMQELGLSNAMLDELNQQLHSHPEILGSKISGSGMGDCVIAIGELQSRIFPQNHQQTLSSVQQFDLHVEPQGVTYATS